MAPATWAEPWQAARTGAGVEQATPEGALQVETWRHAHRERSRSARPQRVRRPTWTRWPEANSRIRSARSSFWIRRQPWHSPEGPPRDPRSLVRRFRPSRDRTLRFYRPLGKRPVRGCVGRRGGTGTETRGSGQDCDLSVCGGFARSCASGLSRASSGFPGMTITSRRVAPRSPEVGASWADRLVAARHPARHRSPRTSRIHPHASRR